MKLSPRQLSATPGQWFFIFLLGERIFDQPALMLAIAAVLTLAAAFFLVHPIQTESVTYISSRSELLSTFFYLWLLVYVFWLRKIGFLCSLAVAVRIFRTQVRKPLYSRNHISVRFFISIEGGFRASDTVALLCNLLLGFSDSTIF